MKSAEMDVRFVRVTVLEVVVTPSDHLMNENRFLPSGADAGTVMEYVPSGRTSE